MILLHTSAATELTQWPVSGLADEMIRLLAAKPTPAVKRKLVQNSEAFIQKIEQGQSVNVFEQHFKDTLDIAAQDPVVLHRFFQMYNYWNGGIASCIAGLVNNIGGSYETLLDPAIQSRGAASYAFEISKWVNEASKDEYADPKHRDIYTGEKLSHRLLAAGLVEGIGDYAGLSIEERNAFQMPDWLVANVDQIQKLYGGARNDLRRNSEALGMHFWSEYSADKVEFSNACKALFVDRKGEGLQRYFELNPLIAIGANTFPACSWLQTHGGWDEMHNEIKHGVEYVHLAAGVNAIALLVGKAPVEQRAAIQKDIARGVTKARKLLDEFFVHAGEEGKLLLEERLAKVPAAGSTQNLSCTGATCG